MDKTKLCLESLRQWRFKQANANAIFSAIVVAIEVVVVDDVVFVFVVLYPIFSNSSLSHCFILLLYFYALNESI